MRAVFDFINGVAVGLGRTPASARRKSEAVDASRPPFALRVSLLVISLCCAGVMLVASTGVLEPKKNHSTVRAPPDLVINLASVLAYDPGAKPRQWKHIVIHHSASRRGNAQSFDASHRERGWRSLGYHFVIGNGIDQGDGVVVAGPRWYSQEAGAHANATEYNEHGIGICLVGNFNEQNPTPTQWAALRELTRILCNRNGIAPADVVGHKHVRRGGSTECPGTLLSLEKLRDEIR